MKKSFPTLSDKELGKLTYRFYGYLTDQLVEFFKGVSISKEEMLDRFEIKNEDIVTDFIKKGIPHNEIVKQLQVKFDYRSFASINLKVSLINPYS